MEMNVKRMLLTAAMLVGVGVTAQAQVVPGAVQLPSSITADRTLSADSVYQLTNTVSVQSGAVLTIQAGCLIYGNEAGTRSCLQILPGAKIYAQGTATKPIIFTTARAQGTKTTGHWGGVIILGNADINPGLTTTIEGGTTATYGGTDDADSSGVFSYCRIENAGLAFGTDNEINGLTLGGVGNRTVIDHIQVSYNNDDSFEWFGGTVNGKYLIAYASIDDDFDTDFGYRGRNQFLFAMRDSLYSDLSSSSSSEGLEADNDATGSANTPISKPIMCNMTLIGPYRDTSTVAWGQDFVRGARLRRNTDYGIFNSVIAHWPTAMGIDQAAPGVNPATPQNTDLACENTVVTGQRRGGAPVSETVIAGTGALTQANIDSWFNAPGNNNRLGNHVDAGLLAVTQTDLRNPDPRPNTTTSPARNGAAFTNTLLATGNNFSFTTTPVYKGAFDPALSRDAQWDKPWSNYKPLTTTYVKHRSGWNLVATANTPANNNKDSIYRNNTSSAFRFNAGYTIDNTLDAGVGYWVQLSDNRVIEQEGTTVALPTSISVVAGWNLVSTGASSRATVANIVATGTAISGTPFGFDNGYSPATVLEPGKAYWINCTTAGTLQFNP